MVKVINYGEGCCPEEIGKIVRVTGLGIYIDEQGVIVTPPIGNSLTGEFGGFIGADSFEKIGWKERYIK